ncbi:MAG: TonB-dependent receptor plug domain-containing protein [Opitutales bacterium]
MQTFRILSASLLSSGILLGNNGEVLPELDAWEHRANPVAIPEAPGSIATVVSELSYSPWVDVQSRNRGELQGDISIRGGTFEGTGFTIAGLTLIDPQTGHYSAEIPVDPAMLSAPEIGLGSAHAASGFNATAGSVAYQLSSVEDEIRVRGTVGSDELFGGSAYFGRTFDDAEWSSDLAVAYSESDGAVEGGRHEFERITGRVQWKNEDARFNVVAGYQDKYFAWPYLYALQELHDLIGTSGIETEQIETTLLLAEYERAFGDNLFSISGYFRENKDDYEFDLEDPGLFNPYQHTTEVIGSQVAYDAAVAGGVWSTGLQFYTDDIESTALVNSPFNSRDYWALSSGWSGELYSSGRTTHNLAFGVRYEDTSEDEAAWSPYARWAIDLERNAGVWQIYLDASQSTKVAGYTVLGGSETGGLFRGNQNPHREYARTYEGGLVFTGETGLNARASIFYREDDDLVDWTFESGSLFARKAENVDIETYGAELFASYSFGWFTGFASYAYLDKDEDYGAVADTVDGSFYALNYADHRFTLGLDAQLTDDLRVLWDQEYRVQAENELRSGAEKVWLHSVAVDYQILESLSGRLAVDNVLDEVFEEVPGVPGTGRSVSVSLEARF